MTIKRHLLAVGLVFFLAAFSAAFGENISSLIVPQSGTIASIIENEKNKSHQANLIDIINTIDSTYTRLHENLKAKQKIIIFFDPAHGKLPDGRWQGGDATLRSSCTNRPEEFYSIIVSRALYSYLKKNPHFEVKSTEDFMDVLEGDSESYDNIPFSATVDQAKKCNAFILLSEHLNNVSVLYKASGKMNIPGIHVINGRGGVKILNHIKSTYSGFLTLYNKLDASGFSRKYALNLKSNLTALGMKPNSWDFGAVGDSRFSYFVDFPVSIIYESGFISNPAEEKQFRDPEFVDKLAGAQYQSLLDTIKDIYSIDISGKTPIITKADTPPMELFKLSRMAVYYLKEADTPKVVEIINTMQKLYGGAGNVQVAYFNQIKNAVVRAENYCSIGTKHSMRKRHKAARRYYYLAWRSINFNPVYSAYKNKYAQMLRIKTYQEGAVPVQNVAHKQPHRPIHAVEAAKSPLSRPIILAIEKNQSLHDAINNALLPGNEMLKVLTDKFSNVEVTEKFRVRKYSAKRKRHITVWSTRRRKISFSEGIYIVGLDKNYNVISAKCVRSVELNPWRFQNQQYLKNSYFAYNEKSKSL